MGDLPQLSPGLIVGGSHSYGMAFLFRLTVLAADPDTTKKCRQTALNEKKRF